MNTAPKDKEAALALVQSAMRIGLLRLNRIQEPFFRVKNKFGRTPKRRVLETGEKCLTYRTLVETIYGEVTIGSLYERGKPFAVFAYDGNLKIVTKASAPFKKIGVHPCYRIEFDDGRWIEAAAHHLILSDGGWRSVQSLYELLQSLRASTSESALTVLPSGVVHWSGKASDFLRDTGKKIVSINLIASQEVYDFQVQRYHNYFAGGLIHHNCGKTLANVVEGISHAMGYRPFFDPSDPDYKISIRIPNQGIIGCMTMAQSVSAKIEPDLESLIPPHCGPVWKRDTTGALKNVTLKYDYRGQRCGSTIHIRSYNQAPETFLGIDYDWYGWDEPPPRPVLVAAERGKTATNAPSWFSMTPLSEAYFFDMFSVKAFNAGGMDPEIAVFRGSMWENCQDYCKHCECYIPANDPVNMANPQAERPINNCPKCGLVMGFIPRAGILEYVKMFSDQDEIAAHIDGKWAHLSGLVYKILSRELHLYRDFEIPKNWMRIEIVDPHDARPTRWLFGAVPPEDVEINGKPASRIYFYTYLLANGNVEEIARQVRVKRAEHNYVTPEMVILDAKFGSKTVKTLEATTSWEEELERAGITRIRLSHSDPGDIAIGHKRVKEYLQPHYSVVRNQSFPAMLFAEDGCRGDRGPIQDMFNYQWKPGTDRPEEAYKDFCDTVRYAALEQPVYRPPGEDDFMTKLLASRKDEDYSPLTYGMRLGATAR